jgi:YhcH/YjgK/YiaL family protein
MILDILENAERYAGAHPAFAAAFAFLRRPDLAKLPEGRMDLDGDNLFALVQRPEGRGQSGARLEAHRKYADIQYVVSGCEAYGWRARADAPVVTEPYVEARDIEFFGGAPSVWLPALPGVFAVFFPEDLHAPLAGTGHLHKVVIKVRV